MIVFSYSQMSRIKVGLGKARTRNSFEQIKVVEVGHARNGLWVR